MRTFPNVGWSIVGLCFGACFAAGCLGDGSIDGEPSGATSAGDAAIDETSITHPTTHGDAAIEGDSSPGHDAARGDGATAPHDSATPPPDVGADSQPPSKPDAAPDTTPPTSTDPLEAARQKCVDQINTYRATLGLPAYARWNAEETCVDGQAAADAAANTAHSAFGKCSEWAQNECPGWGGTPSTIMDGCLKAMWAEGPGVPFEQHGHFINMSSKDYTKVSCGFHQTADGHWWATQDFK